MLTAEGNLARMGIADVKELFVAETEIGKKEPQKSRRAMLLPLQGVLWTIYQIKMNIDATHYTNPPSLAYTMPHTCNHIHLRTFTPLSLPEQPEQGLPFQPKQ